MIILNGKKQINISKDEFAQRAAMYEKTVLDLGTGDGRNVYKKALAQPQTLYIGLDAAADNMLEIASKITRKPEKGGAPNVLLAVAGVESLPTELYGCADEITVFFPWGTLLEGVVKPLPEFIKSIALAAKKNSRFEFVTTYSDSYEDTTISQRGLPELSTEYFSGEYKKALQGFGLELENIEKLDNEFAKGFDSRWAKRLAFGRKREFYRLTGRII